MGHKVLLLIVIKRATCSIHFFSALEVPQTFAPYSLNTGFLSLLLLEGCSSFNDFWTFGGFFQEKTQQSDRLRKPIVQEIWKFVLSLWIKFEGAAFMT